MFELAFDFEAGAELIGFENLYRFVKGRAAPQPRYFGARTGLQPIQRGGRVNERDLASASCRRQPGVQFISARCTNWQQTENCRIGLGKRQKSSYQKLILGPPVKIGHWTKEHVCLNSAARTKPADPVGDVNSPFDVPAN